MLKNNLVAVVVLCLVGFALIAVAFLVLPGLLQQSGGAGAKNKPGDSGLQQFVANNIAAKGSSIRIENSEDIAPGVVRFESYETIGNGLEHYRLIILDKNTGQYFVVAEHMTSANSSEEYTARINAAIGDLENDSVCKENPGYC